MATDHFDERVARAYDVDVEDEFAPSVLVLPGDRGHRTSALSASARH